MCTVQVTKWKGDRARRSVGAYKLLHAGGVGWSNGMEIIVSVIKQGVRVERCEGQIVMAWVVMQRQILCVMSIYGPQTGRTGVEKQ